jgi:hypothetical protein
MPEPLLSIVRRGEHCAAECAVNGGDERAFLRCDLKPGHAGPLHYDATDRIWWSADA